MTDLVYNTGSQLCDILLGNVLIMCDLLFELRNTKGGVSPQINGMRRVYSCKGSQLA